MATFGNLDNIQKQLNHKAFQVAFRYLEKISDDFLDLKEGECIKEMITDDIFVLKQAYYTKNREDCFFESHKKYIDIQYMVKGEEIMDVSDIENLNLITPYDKNTDFIKYDGNKNISSLCIKEKELAIFFPEDGHQPCIKTDKSVLVYKAVIKIPNQLF